MKVLIDIDEFKDWLKDEVYKTDLSEVMPKIDDYFEIFGNKNKLSDAEQRLFLSAITREMEVCKKSTRTNLPTQTLDYSFR